MVIGMAHRRLLKKAESPALDRALEVESGRRAGASETPGPDETLGVSMVLEHLAVEAPPRFTLGSVSANVGRQSPRSRPDHGAPSRMDGDVEPQIGAVHGQAASPVGPAANGSTSLWMG